MAVAVSATAAAAPKAEDGSFYARRYERQPSIVELMNLGRALFFSKRLSANGRLACASCHDPRYGYAAPNAQPVQLGGTRMRASGMRAVPALRYLQTVPPFAQNRFEEAPDDSEDQGPSGGYTWDGRVDSVHDQVSLPLLSPYEMGNPNPAELIARLRPGPLGDALRTTFGDSVFSDEARAFDALRWALEVYLQDPATFYPYTSAYDDWLRGKATLSAQAQRGLKWFNDPRKGDCARCHPSQSFGGAFPQFTDFGYAALGVPRNRAIPANADPKHFDLGLCGPLRVDLRDHPEYCGMFRAPSLRNVAVRKSYFHNGVFHELRRVIEFYAQRDTRPERWYPRAPSGMLLLFDDLPAPYWANVERGAPFGRHPGDPPALTSVEIDDLLAFLETLTDADLRAAARSQR
jgi:cytochrome c peroxidase